MSIQIKKSFSKMAQALILAKYPIALASDSNHYNADVYEKRNKIYQKTSMKCKVAISISQKPDFVGVCPFEDNDEIIQILKKKENSIILNDSFYCLKCCMELQGHSENIKRHINTKKHQCHIEKLLPSEVNQLAVSWFTSHQISFAAIADPIMHILVPSLSSLPVFKKIIKQSSAIIQLEIIKKLEEAQYISIASDGWRTKESRKLGVAFHASNEKGETDTYFAALRDTPKNTLGAVEITKIIKDVMTEYKIDERKLVAFVSDSASDMASTANNLGLPWDRCFCHIISNIIEESLSLLPERFDRIHNNLVALKKSARWIEYFNHIYKVEHEDYKNYFNLTTSVPTRWGTRIEEALSMLTFKDAIESYYQHENINQTKPGNILKSDFEMINDLKDVFEFILTKIKELQDKQVSSNIGLVAFKLIQIADAAYDFFVSKEQEREKAQKEADDEYEKNPSRTRRIVPLSHLAEPILNIYDKIKEVFIDSEEEFCMRMKAAMIFDPHIPLDLPPYCSDYVGNTLEWIKGKIDLAESASQTINRQNETPFYRMEIGSQDPAITSITSLEQWMEVRQYFSNCVDPRSLWKSQIHSELKSFVLSIFAHRVSNASVESFFSICGGFVDDNNKIIDSKVHECLGIIACNKDIYTEKIISPIRHKYRI